MDKTTMILNNGSLMTVYYPDDYVFTDKDRRSVEEVEIRPEDIEPGTMAALCRNILRSLQQEDQRAV